MSIQVDSAFAVPTETPDLPNTISLITRITKDDPRLVLADCKSRKSFCWVARKASAETIERLKSLNLQGIYYQKESKRFYPKRELAAQVLGYVGTDDEGLSGIEREYNDQLRGKPGRMLIQVDARKKWFGRVEKQPDPGQNLVLTIDENIQYIAERELEQAMKETKSEAGTVIVRTRARERFLPSRTGRLSIRIIVERSRTKPSRIARSQISMNRDQHSRLSP